MYVMIRLMIEIWQTIMYCYIHCQYLCELCMAFAPVSVLAQYYPSVIVLSALLMASNYLYPGQACDSCVENE